MAEKRGLHKVAYDPKLGRYKCVVCGKLVSRKPSDDICVREALQMAEARPLHQAG